ncbi:MAG: cytochrome c peroxidase [Pararhodobacter sp.]
MPRTLRPATALLCCLLTAPLPLAADVTQIDAGRALFNDTGLSGAGLHSCATCHPVTMGLEGHTTNNTYIGLDVVPDGAEGARSSPTLWGAHHRTQWGWAEQIGEPARPTAALLADLVAYLEAL